MAPAPLSAGFQSLPLLPTIKLGPSSAVSRVGGLVHALGPVGLSNKLSCEAGSFSCCRLNPHRRFGVLFPCAGTLGCAVCLIPQLFLLVYLHTEVEPPTLPAAALPALVLQLPQQVLSTRIPISAPPTSLCECFFFNSLVVRLPYSSIFCQFWLFFVFKFVVVLLVVGGGTVCLQCVYLHLHLGRKSYNYFLSFHVQ